ncbi:MAG: GCD complex subunit gcd7 [Cirrosporium novae-zelandiae]|nr:MAG: GCD complex subunit gcd7 [Cirrosporium novae-zelandiae]
MAPNTSTTITTPGLAAYLSTITSYPIESSIEHLVALLKRRQIRSSRPCAIATARLLLRVVHSSKAINVEKLVEHVQRVGRRLIAAQPREMAVGNIVRRVLGLIRSEAEEDREGEMSLASDISSEMQSRSPTIAADRSLDRPGLSSSISTLSPLKHAIEPGIDGEQDVSFTSAEHVEGSSRPPLLTSHTSYAANASAPMATSMFNLLSHPQTSPTATPPGSQSPNGRASLTTQNVASLSSLKELKQEVVEGISEIIDELSQVDDQIAAYALEHIHQNEIILTLGSSTTVQKFLLKAAAKRKFTVIVAESYPIDQERTYKTVTGVGNTDTEDKLSHEAFQKPLATAGITVILIPDSAVFALISRVNKVILGTHTVLASGLLVTTAGAKTIAMAARAHKVPVLVLSGVYKLSPVYPFDFDSLIEYGDASKIIPYEDGDLVDKVDVVNPLFDYVPAELVDLYITNL